MRELLLTRDDWRLIMHFTRNWLHYGWMAATAFCVIAGAVERFMGA
ncbi:MAG TPA: hypothetical protein VKU01_15785 [Bryobacteraceae bacterium]|nr:hypothetical protein [Bryobacteraceae bacterium]